MKMKRRSFIKGLIGAIAAPKVLKAGDSDTSVLKAKAVSDKNYFIQKVSGKEELFHKNEDGCETQLSHEGNLTCTTAPYSSRPPLIRGYTKKQTKQYERIYKHLMIKHNRVVE